MKSNLYQQLQSKIYWCLEKSIQTGSITLENKQVSFGSSLGRRSNNQDRIVSYRINFPDTLKPNISGMILCDGMGGMVEGDDCANLAISSFLSSLVSSISNTLSEKIRLAVIDANNNIYEKYRGKGGTTLSAIASDDSESWTTVNVGDSRIYSLSIDGRFEQLTIDDTLERQLIDLKLPSLPRELMQLLQFVGMGEDITVSTRQVRVSKQIRCFVLTSDGAHKIPNDLFDAILRNSTSYEDIVTRLITISEWLGGKDNATIGVLSPTWHSLSNKNQNTHSGSLEIWNLSGKVEFFTVSSSHKKVSKTLQHPAIEVDRTKEEPNKSSESNPKTKKSPKVNKVKDNTNSKVLSLEERNTDLDNVPTLDLEFGEGDVEW